MQQYFKVSILSVFLLPVFLSAMDIGAIWSNFITDNNIDITSVESLNCINNIIIQGKRALTEEAKEILAAGLYDVRELAENRINIQVSRFLKLMVSVDLGRNFIALVAEKALKESNNADILALQLLKVCVGHGCGITAAKSGAKVAFKKNRPENLDYLITLLTALVFNDSGVNEIEDMLVELFKEKNSLLKQINQQTADNILIIIFLLLNNCRGDRVVKAALECDNFIDSRRILVQRYRLILTERLNKTEIL